MKKRIIVEVEVEIECDEIDFYAAGMWAANFFHCNMRKWGKRKPWDAVTIETGERKWRTVEDGDDLNSISRLMREKRVSYREAKRIVEEGKVKV